MKAPPQKNSTNLSISKLKEKSQDTLFESHPLVSVGVLSFNRPEGLRRALTGIIGQTYKNLDIMISDDASTDPEVENVLKEFENSDTRIRCFRHSKNMGFIRNFQFTYKQSDAEYFMWAANDDVMDPEFVEVCLRNLLNPEYNAVLSFTHVRRCRDDGTVVVADYADPVSIVTRSLLRRSFRYLYYSGSSQCVYGLYRRRDINHWFFEHRFGNDQLAFLVLLRRGNIYFDSRVLYSSGMGGAGFNRSYFHNFYKSKTMKICVNISSTLTWFYEFIRCIWLTPYRPHEKIALWLFTVIRFLRPRYWRRFAGDMLALVARRDIWNFK